MRTRLDLDETSVSPFSFPPLKNGGAAAPNPSIPAVEPTAPAQTGASPSVPTQSDAIQDPANDTEAAAAAIAAEFAKARAEGLQSGLEEGRKEGWAAGFVEGKQAGEASLAEGARRLTAIVARLGAPLIALEPPVEEAIVALALEVARCVIGEEIKRSREFLVRLVREAVAKVPLEMGAPRVLVNPADLDLIRSLLPEFELGSAVVIGDETIEAGGCLVIADGEDRPIKDRRWNPRAAEGVSQVNLTLSSRWRAVMLTLFDGEDG
jgi:flagellar assembly protein FliH